MNTYRLFINNEWMEARDGRTFVSRNPANGENVARLALAGAEDVRLAVEAARHSFASGIWSQITPDARADIMLRAAELMKARLPELARYEALETGKPIRETEEVDIPYSVRAMEYFANQAREIRGYTIPIPGEEVFDWVSYEPYGVVAAVVPWNFPLHLATRAVCPALAAGNSVVLKPSSLTSITAVIMGEILLEAGLPQGVLNIVTGSGGETGEALLRHPDVSMITFTGSLDVGREILRISAESPVMKTLVLELGGKGPFIAEADCRIDEAVNQLIKGFCLMQGEVCCASTRLYVHKQIAAEFLRILISRLESLRFGDTMDHRTQIGSLISIDHLEKVHSAVVAAVKAGAKLETGGERFTDPPCDRGAFYRPTVLTGVRDDMACHREEIFGPVLTVQEYTDLDDAIRSANANQYALGATVFSENYRTLYKAARMLQAGTVWLNTNVMSKIEAPYGGDKNSGIGRENGAEGIKSYMRIKNTVLNLSRGKDEFYGF